MKTYHKCSFCALLIASIAISSCNSKIHAENERGLAIIDSLKITDADEKKVCIQFDENITDFIGDLQTAVKDSANFTPTQKSDLEKKFGDEMDKLSTQANGIRQKIQSDAVEKKKFEDFSAYEMQRLFAVAAKFK